MAAMKLHLFPGGHGQGRLEAGVAVESVTRDSRGFREDEMHESWVMAGRPYRG